MKGVFAGKKLYYSFCYMLDYIAMAKTNYVNKFA
jgi:hypothetical protein